LKPKTRGLKTMPREILGEEFFTIEETGKILGLSKVAIRDMLKRKRIEGRKIGTRWYFTKKDIKAFLDRKSPPPGSIEETMEEMGL